MDHTCKYSGCKKGQINGSSYCESHTTKNNNISSKHNSIERKSDSSKPIPADPYDVMNFDDPEDFADHWADDFGDENYEEGWDDAFMYWEDHH